MEYDRTAVGPGSPHGCRDRPITEHSGCRARPNSRRPSLTGSQRRVGGMLYDTAPTGQGALLCARDCSVSPYFVVRPYADGYGTGQTEGHQWTSPQNSAPANASGSYESPVACPARSSPNSAGAVSSG
ncbi:hypothetical protein GCM10010298_76860 [Streptomyces microflavus]|uniref:Uncharacterized protein n=1 Tax=Streptomyces microflavus TaxID=1919 RepID=A0A7J0D6M2_STRMI|nr:hypothetical protein Smic_78030 [Streptomyces microflavus]GFN09705.1 hypothetical protein Smic_82610 [Streptomyces microflavus]GGY00503.1 hypothetical protein GCM10010298_76860 [Streptomyces microflavus]